MLSKMRIGAVGRALQWRQKVAFSGASNGSSQEITQRDASSSTPSNQFAERRLTPEERYPGPPDVSQFAYMEYRKFPNHLPHFNRDSPEYIPSFRDDFRAEHTTNSYNYYIDRLKKDIETQRQVHDILRRMDRPYLRGLPGQTRNVTGGLKDYSQPLPGVERGLDEADEATKFLNTFHRNEDRWLNQSVFYPKYAPMPHHDVEWQKELDARPVTRDFNKVKGYKYDVTTPYEQRYDYLADRLGHPEILGSPWERLLRLEGEIYHPNWLDQPFVKVPSPEPHLSLNFEAGEVIYENARLTEWAKFWKYTTTLGYVFCAYFVPFQLLFKTHMPLEYAFDNLFIPYYTRSMFFWDNNAIHVPVVSLVAMYATYIALSSMHNISRDYVVRAQYSKDKELLFVTRITPFGSTEEEVYEMPHLEFVPPSVQSGIGHLSAQDADGLYDITCLNSHRQLIFYNEEKYWNPAQRKEFFERVMNFWTPDYNGFSRNEYRQWITEQAARDNDGSTLQAGETKKIGAPQ